MPRMLTTNFDVISDGNKIWNAFSYIFRRAISESIKNDVASEQAKVSLIKVVVSHPTTMEKDRCYLISTKRPKETIKEENPKIQADYCNKVTNIYISFSSRAILL